MEMKQAGNFYISIRLWGLAILLILSVLGNIQQNRLINQERSHLMAVKREVASWAKEETERRETRAKKNAQWAASDARVQQLYREIDSLSRFNEQVVARPQNKQSTLLKTDGQTEKPSAPLVRAEAQDVPRR